MAKFLKKENRTIVPAGFEKFRIYADPRGLTMDKATYGVYKVKHNGKVSEREACRATGVIDGQPVSGWIINIANRQRTFKEDGSGYEVYPLKGK